MLRRIARAGNHIGDFFGDDAGFAAACAGQHKQRPAQIAHRFQLALVQFHGVGAFSGSLKTKIGKNGIIRQAGQGGQWKTAFSGCRKVWFRGLTLGQPEN